MVLKNKIGSSFIEVIFSISLIVLILLPIYGRTIDVFANQELGNQYLIANGILEKKIAFTKTKPQADIIVGSTNENIGELPNGNLQTNITNYDIGQPAIYRVDFTISWQGKGNIKNIDMTTLINVK